MVVDDSFIDNAKWLISVLIIPFAVWFWRKHEKDHEVIDEDRRELWKASRRLEDSMLTASSGLNDRIMEHIDVQITEVKQLVRDEDRKLTEEQHIQRGHIGKLFEKIEETRKDTTQALAANAARAEDRHNEVLGVLREMTTSFHVALNQKADK